MDAGINQLVDTYKGNPAPLQQQVQREQKQQPQGELPPDLEEAIALQKIAELQNSARNQQAMQAGGAQPTIIDKLRQMLGGNRPQAQMAQASAQGQGQVQPPMGSRPMMPAQPVRAASGGSIAQLVSNLGNNYAGGGIIAFSGQDGSKVPTEAELEAQRKADREKIDALARALGETGGEYAGKSMAALADIAALIPRGLAGAVDTAMIRPARALGANVDYLSPALTPGNQSSDTMTPFYDRYIRAKETSDKTPSETPSETPTVQSSKPGTTYEKPGNIAAPTVNNMYTDKDGKTFVRPVNMSDEAWKKLVATARTEQTPTSQGAGDKIVPRYPVSAPQSAPAPTANAPAAPKPPSAPSVAAPQKVDPNSLRALAEKYIRDEMALNPETESDKMVARGRKIMGLDDLLAEKTQRANAREQAIEQAKANRTPDWIRGLQAAGGAPVRGGIGMLLNRVGSEMANTRENYAAQDLAYQAELDRLRDVITDAKISGNKELAKEGMAAYKEVDARRKAALTSATSLLKTDEETATRLQIAREGAANRAQIAAGQADERKARRLQDQANFLAKLQSQHEATLNKDPEYTGMVKQKQMLELQLSVTKDDKKIADLTDKLEAQQDKMAAYAAKKIGGGLAGAANIPPPPKDAVKRIG